MEEEQRVKLLSGCHFLTSTNRKSKNQPIIEAWSEVAERAANQALAGWGPDTPAHPLVYWQMAFQAMAELLAEPDHSSGSKRKATWGDRKDSPVLSQSSNERRNEERSLMQAWSF